MSFFRNFPIVGYRFGDEITPTLFQKITSYIDLVDQVSDDTSVYEFYTIIDGERPDVLSYKLYQTQDFYWTFYLLNEKIRIQGWPLTSQEIYTLSKLYYPNTTVVTNSSMHGEFYVGDTVATKPFTGPSFKGVILEKNLDIGQMVLKPIKEVRSFTITNGGSGYSIAPTVTLSSGGGYGATAQAILTSDVVTSIVVLNPGEGYTSAPVVTITAPELSRGINAAATAVLSSNSLPNSSVIYSVANQPDVRLWDDDLARSLIARTTLPQYESVHHYEDAIGNWVDLSINANGIGVDNTTGTVANYTSVTHLERLIEQNTSLAQIKVFKPAVAAQIDAEFQRLLKAN
jgi:hypothetical protein